MEVIVKSNNASGHSIRFLLSLTGQNFRRFVDVYVGQVGTPEAVAVAVPFAEVVMVGKVEGGLVEKVDRVFVLWFWVRERGRALGGGKLVRLRTQNNSPKKNSCTYLKTSNVISRTNMTRNGVSKT